VLCAGRGAARPGGEAHPRTGTERNLLLLHDVLICEWNGFLQAVTCLLIRVDFYIIIKMYIFFKKTKKKSAEHCHVI
jgi:hypothetical protein